MYIIYAEIIENKYKNWAMERGFVEKVTEKSVLMGSGGVVEQYKWAVRMRGGEKGDGKVC